jgi:hypothetical protein
MRSLRSLTNIYACRRAVAAATLCLLAVSGAQNAANAQATASYSVSANLGSTATPFGPSGLLSVAQYNPVLYNYGNLQSVKITWTISTTINWSYTNHGTDTNITTASNKASGVIYFPSTSTTVGSSIATTSPYASYPHAIAAGQTLSGTSTATGSTDTTIVPGTDARGHVWTSANLVTFTGSGNVTFNVQGVASNTFSNTNGNITASIQTYITGTVTVTYTYYLVPEPGTWAFMLSGCGTGVYALRRRKRKLLEVA